MMDWWIVCDPDGLVLVARVGCGTVLLAVLLMGCISRIVNSRADDRGKRESVDTDTDSSGKEAATQSAVGASIKTEPEVRRTSVRKNPPLKTFTVESTYDDADELYGTATTWAISPHDKAGYAALDPMKTDKSEIPAAAQNLSLNRHFDVLPNPMTRVHLTELPGEPASGYINANFVRGFGGRPQAYICSQGAMEDTVESFWRMVWEQDVASIVMTTGLVEGGSTKCVRYWPEQGQTLLFGFVTVTTTKQVEHSGFIVHTLKLSQRGSGVKQVKHFWFHSWPDHGIPKNGKGKPYTPDVLDLRAQVKANQHSMGSTAPVLSHCSAGVGRSGTYIAIDFALEALAETGKIDVLDVVRQIRNDRVSLVQHLAQYKFVRSCCVDVAKQQGITVIAAKVDPNEQSFFVASQKKPARPVTQYDRPESGVEVDEDFSGFGTMVIEDQPGPALESQETFGFPQEVIDAQPQYEDMGGLPAATPTRPKKRGSTRKRLGLESDAAMEPEEQRYVNVPLSPSASEPEEEQFGFN